MIGGSSYDNQPSAAAPNWYNQTDLYRAWGLMITAAKSGECQARCERCLGTGLLASTRSSHRLDVQQLLVGCGQLSSELVGSPQWRERAAVPGVYIRLGRPRPRVSLNRTVPGSFKPAVPRQHDRNAHGGERQPGGDARRPRPAAEHERRLSARARLPPARHSLRPAAARATGRPW